MLNGKTVVVTGASAGIGAAAPGMFVEHGANVVLGARRGALLDELVSQIKDQNGNAVALAGIFVMKSMRLIWLCWRNRNLVD